MKIRIKTCNIKKLQTYTIDSEQNVFTISGKPVEQNIEDALIFIDTLTSSWPETLTDSNTQDGLIVKIMIKDGIHNRTMLYKNKFPENFTLLTNFLNEVERNVSRTL